MVLLWCGFCRLRERERESRLKILQALLLKAHTSAKLQKKLKREREGFPDLDCDISKRKKGLFINTKAKVLSELSSSMQ